MLTITFWQFFFHLFLGITALGVWFPRAKRWGIIPNATHLLFACAIFSWVAGVITVHTALNQRGATWLATPNRDFTFEKRDYSKLTDEARHEQRQYHATHHSIERPAEVADRLPARFDTQTRAITLTATFTLLPNGNVRDVKVTQPSGDTLLDTETVRSITKWQFTPLAAASLNQAPEKVTVAIGNNYRFTQPTGKLVLFVVLVTVLWGVAVRYVPDGGSERLQLFTRRLVLVAGYLGAMGWLFGYRLAADLDRPAMPEKQGKILLTGLCLLAVLPHVIAWLRPRAERHLQNAPKWWRQGWHLGLLGVFLLLLTKFTPLGTDNGTEAKLWLRLGPFTFQTMELVKLLFIGFLALIAHSACSRTAVSKADKPVIINGKEATLYAQVGTLGRQRGVLLLTLLLCGALWLMSDFGPLLLIALFTLLVLALFGERRLSWGGFIVLTALLLVTALLGKPARWGERVSAMQNPWTAKTDNKRLAGSQENLARAQWALSSGGINGRGLGKGDPTDVRVVEADFIYCAIAEEIGVKGAFFLLSLLCYLSFASLQLARERKDAYERIFLSGVGMLQGAQALLLLAGNLRLFPLTGITLPFLSHGGASLLLSFLTIALVCGTLVAHRQHPVSLPRAEGEIDSRLNRISWLLALGFLVVAAATLHLNVNPAFAYRHTFLRTAKEPVQNPRLRPGGVTPVVPGKITDRNGKTLSEHTPRGRDHQPQAESLPLLQIENVLRDILKGLPQGKVALPTSSDLLGARGGYNVALTIDQKLQKEVTALLGARKGSIVGVVPQTGEILFAVSTSAPRVQKNALPLPAWLGRGYAPGSTFKTVITQCGLEAGLLTPETTQPCTGDAYGIHDFAHVRHGALTLSQALPRSCNAYFARTANAIGWERLTTFTEEKAGFGKHLPLIPPVLVRTHETGLDAEPSSLISTEVRQKKGKALGETGIGQWDVHMTPLHLALWTGAIANGGTLHTPQILTQITNAQGKELWKSKPTLIGDLLTPAAVRHTATLMRGVVQQPKGTAHNAFRDCRILVAGKTGTADKDNGTKNALFIGFAPYDNPKIAIAVVIENAGAEETGGKTAAPLARAVIEAALGHKGADRD